MADLDLLVIGDLNPDLVLAGGDVHPRFGQVETIVETADLVIGGSAAITAVGASRLGLEVGLCAVVGADRRGDMIRDLVVEEGVETTAVRVDIDTPTGITVVLVDGSDRAMLTTPGTIGSLRVADVAALPDRPADHVHVASYYLMGDEFRFGVVPHLRRFRDAGSSVSIDTNWDPSEEWDLADLLDGVDVFLPNENELLAITGSASIEGALSSVEAGRPQIVVKMGRSGAATVVDGSVVRVPAPDVGGFVDAIGAGDGFNAGYLTAMLAGASVTDAIAVGVAVGSLSTRGCGGTAAQPSRAEAWAVAGLSG